MTHHITFKAGDITTKPLGTVVFRGTKSEAFAHAKAHRLAKYASKVNILSYKGDK